MSLQVHTSSDVRVAPYDSLIWAPPLGGPRHKGGPIWDNWEGATRQRHCLNRKAIDNRPDAVGFSASTPRINEGFWCGPICGHFGHQVAEFSTRIPAYLGRHHSDARLLFGLRRNADTGNIPGFFKQLLAWYEIPTHHVLIHSAPIVVTQLHWAPQQEQLRDVPPAANYVNSLSMHSRKKLGDPGNQGKTVYVSRAGILAGGIAGERYIEEFFSGQGFTVMKPQNLTLEEQLSLYQHASVLVFSEGSALHGLQLLGRLRSRIAVVVRRPGMRMLEKILSARVEKLDFIDCIESMIKGITLSGSLSENIGITVLNASCFLEQLDALGISRGGWNGAAFASCVTQDLNRWFQLQLDRVCRLKNNSVQSDSIATVQRELAALGHAL